MLQLQLHIPLVEHVGKHRRHRLPVEYQRHRLQ
jgi:hypothetical protein